MKFAFDLDGTITASPTALRAIMHALNQQGHEVIVLTAVDGGEKNRAQRLQMLASCGCVEFTRVVCVQDGDEKADFCQREKVDCMFEDSEDYLRRIKEKNPNISAWLIK